MTGIGLVAGKPKILGVGESAQTETAPTSKAHSRSPNVLRNSAMVYTAPDDMPWPTLANRPFLWDSNGLRDGP